MRILFVSASPIKKELSIGNTFLNLFDGIEDVEMASICTRPGVPDPKISRCFCITEKMLVKNIIKGTEVGTELEIKEKTDIPATEGKSIGFAKKYRFTVFFWLQDLVWKIGKWKSKKLSDFITEYNPDVIFTVMSNSVYLNNLILHTKKISKKKLVVYAWDNNYSLKQFMFSPFRWLKLFIDRSSMRKVAKAADLLYVISNVQKDDYTKAFKKQCRLLTKSADFTQQPNIKASYSKPLQLIYTGNIGLNRWKSLAHIANVLEKINNNEVKAQLRIYTGNTVTKKMCDALNKGNSSFVMGSVASDKVIEIQRDADMLVHVEALDLRNKLTVRQSFSTKIVDYLAASRPVLVFGPKDVASVDHFVKNDCAIVADNEDELFDKLCAVISDNNKLNELSRRAFECGKKFHNKDDIENMLRKDLEELTRGV